MRLSKGTQHLFILSYSFFVIVQNLGLPHILHFYSADSVMIILLVKPPTHGWSSPKGYKGESVKFK